MSILNNSITNSDTTDVELPRKKDGIKYGGECYECYKCAGICVVGFVVVLVLIGLIGYMVRYIKYK